MVTHDNITWTVEQNCVKLHPTEEDVLVSFLPLSHIAAQHLDIHIPMRYGIQVRRCAPQECCARPCPPAPAGALRKARRAQGLAGDHAASWCEAHGSEMYPPR